MLDVVQPDAFIHGAIRAMKHAIAIRLVVAEFPLVKVAIRVPECTLAVRFVVLPLTLVFGSILPDLDAEAMTNTPRAIVHLVTVNRLHARARLANNGW